MAVLVAMPKYEAYKKSGVEWVGSIPSEWDIKPGFIAYSENKRNNKGLKEERVLSLSYGNIIVKPKEKLVGLVPESFETYQIVEPGDIIIRCMDLQNDKTSLRIGLAENDGIITSAYLNLKVKNNFNPKFIYYYLHSLDTTKVLYKFGTGLRQNLSFVDFYRLPVFDIPKSKQTAIANFLDKKTAQIDEAISIKQKQIELLKERKQIIIQKAVTQGLDSNVSLRDSGVDWIGEIPENWDIKPGFVVFYENKSLNKGLIEEQVLSLSYGNIIIKPKDKLVGLVPESFETYQIIKPGNIIVRCMDLQNDKTSLRTAIAKNNGIITSAYLSLNSKGNYNADYLHYYLHVFDITKAIYKYGSGLRQNLSYKDFKSLPIILPTVEEQGQIVKFIEKQLNKIDEAMHLQQTQIEKLKEYKNTLINSAVTGKIKVPMSINQES